MKILAACTALLCLFASSPSHGGSQEDERARAVADIDAFVRRAMREVGTTPGLALAVVEGDRVLMTAGYGVTDVRSRRPVDPDTGFYIASATKSFTALAIAAMARRGAFDLDAPIADWLADSGLADDIARLVSLTDLLGHRSGLENEPLTFRAAYSGETDPAAMQALLAQTRRSADTPQGTFDYSNTGYNLATTLLGERTGVDWRETVRDEVLAPAGMTRTTGWVSQARAAGPVALGHRGDGPGEAAVNDLQKVDATMHSAGGLISTANDLARWLALQLNDGVVDGRRVFPAGLVASTHQPVVSQDRDFGAYHREGYGLGWQIARYRGERLVHHFGNFSGSRAHVSFMPERGIGVAVLVNEEPVVGELADVVANHVYDRLLERPDLDRAARDAVTNLAADRDHRRAALAAARAERAARPWRLSRPLASYVGVYDNAAMGRLAVRLDDGRMRIDLGVMSALAEPFDAPDAVRVELAPFQGQVIQFTGPDTLVFDDATFRRR